MLGEKYQAVAYLLSLSRREECGSSELAGGERELNKSVRAGEQKKGTRDTRGEVLLGAAAKFMEYSRVRKLRKQRSEPCVLTKRRLLIFQSDPSYLSPHWMVAQTGEGRQSSVVTLHMMRVHLTLRSHFNPNSGFNPGIIHAAGALEFDKSIENPWWCDQDKDEEHTLNIKVSVDARLR